MDRGATDEYDPSVRNPDRYLDPPTRGRKYRYRRRIPVDVAGILEARGELPRSGWIKLSLKTVDLAEARHRRDQQEAADELYWASILKGENDATVQYQRATLVARRAKLPYLSADHVAELPLEQLVERVEKAMSMASETADGAAAGLLGGVDKPSLSVTNVFEYWRDNIASLDRSTKTERQYKRSLSTRQAAVTQFVEAVGDIDWSALDRAAALQFRSWLKARVDEGVIQAQTGDRRINGMQGLWTAYAKEVGREGKNPFRELRLTAKGVKPARRQSVSIEVIQSWLAPGALGGINAEAVAILMVLADTGCRLAEICNLSPDDIQLSHNIPHLIIQAGDQKALKTRSSERTMPLVGLALEAMRSYPEGFPSYYDRSPQLSALLNKVLRARGLLPDGVTIYGLRHAWKDRAIAGRADEELREVLMGHAVGHVVYGEQGSLQDRLEVMLVAKVPPSSPSCE